jgi:nitrite reductase/ring-hydroxylating ferredoxin subunit
MAESIWIPVIEDGKLKEESIKAIFPKGLSLLLIRKSGNEIYALSNKCPHMACPLSAGKLEGYILKCSCHDWRFDIRTGELLEAPEIRILPYEWKISGGQVWVKL